MTAPALSITDLRVEYPTATGGVSALDGVSLQVAPGEVLGLVGESGCGKSTLAQAALGLLPEAAQVSGSIVAGGAQVVGASPVELRRLRGNTIAMVFQDPSTSLDPTFSIGSQVQESILAHQKVSRSEARARAVALLRQVGIPDAAARYSTPPHRFSGGMRQRVVIAAAVANNPGILIADEPTTALDVTIQAQILELMRSLARERGTAIVLITHDLSVVAQVCDRAAVMYAGQLVEEAPVAALFSSPRHPYTRALLAALPTRDARPGQLAVIPGQVPDLAGELPGCRYLNRCPLADERCTSRPQLQAVGDSQVACWVAQDGALHD